MELIGIKVSTSWHGNKTWGTVVSEIEEYLGILVGLEDWTLGSGLVSLEDGNDVLGGNIFTLVIDLASSVDIFSWGSGLSWLVEKFSWEWVGSAVGNIIVGKVDNLVLWDTLLLQNLVSMASVSLMSVVGVGVRSGNNDGPVVRGGSLSSTNG